MDFNLKSLTLIARRLFHLRPYSKIVTDQFVTFDVNDSKKLLNELEMCHREGYTCLISNCKVCSKKASGNLYINKTTGFYMCEKCQCQGEWTALKPLFLSAKAKNMRLSKSDIQALKSSHNGFTLFEGDLKMSDSLRTVSNLPSEEIKLLLQKFNLPCVELEVIEHLGVLVDHERSSLYFPLRTTENLISAFKVISSPECEDVNSRGMDGSGLLIVRPDKFRNVAWRSHLVKPVTTAVLVPSIADTFALVKAGVKNHIVCLPQGVSSLPIDVLPQLEQYEKIILWLGDSNGAWDAVRNFAKKLNETRCYVIKPCTDASNARTAFDCGLDIVKMILEAKPLYIESVTSFKGIKDDVLAELQNIGKVEGVKWRHFPLLNHLLKGFRRGELTVLSGSTGCGKTTFMSQYSLDLVEQGVNTLWGSFEIPNHRLGRIMLTQMAGVPLAQNMDLFNQYSERLENLPMYFMKLHGEHSSNKVLKVVEHAAYVYDIAHVIIDTVQFMMGVTEDSSTMDRFWRQDNIIAGFRSFATSCNCHVTLIIHPRKERSGESLHLNSVFGGGKATQEADNVFMIQDERETNGQISLKVLKNRYCGDLGKMPLEFNKMNLCFVQKKAAPELWKRIDEANEHQNNLHQNNLHQNNFYRQHKQKQWW